MKNLPVFQTGQMYPKLTELLMAKTVIFPAVFCSYKAVRTSSVRVLKISSQLPGSP
ncbi:MAG: hypothetical protein IJ805_07595 [Lachnospiraceae bacterium]|nr:hypothetical protein [Lachnospiraceae bacterium]